MLRKSTVAMILLGFWACCVAGEIPKFDRSGKKTSDTRVVGMECHKKNKTLEVGYFSAYNIPLKFVDLWDTQDLRKNSEGGRSEFYEVVRPCNIGNDRYVVRFRADGLTGWGYGGACGAVTGARARIYKNGEKVFDDLLEECGFKEVITKVKFGSGFDKPEITRTSNDEFMFGGR